MPMFTLATPSGHTVLAFVFEGRGYFSPEKDPFTYDIIGENYFDIRRDPWVDDGTLVVFEDGDQITATTDTQDLRFLFISGRPLKEPVAWQGPIVMNTQAELRKAFEEFSNGIFIK